MNAMCSNCKRNDICRFVGQTDQVDERVNIMIQEILGGLPVSKFLKFIITCDHCQPIQEPDILIPAFMRKMKKQTDALDKTLINIVNKAIGGNIIDDSEEGVYS